MSDQQQNNPVDEHHGKSGAFVINADGKRVPDPNAVTTSTDKPATAEAVKPKASTKAK